jgi:hypothetical protein
MYPHKVPIRLARTLAPHRFATGALVALALLSTACSNDSASRINAPPLLSSASNSQSVAASIAPSLLGSASGFAALSGTGVTCTTSTVTGDVGLVGGAFTNTGPCTINGIIHAGDGVATQAYADFLAAYGALADVSCDQTLTGTLAGVTLSPGVYCFTAAAALTGTLTLNGPADGVWIFKIGTGGTGALTGTNFSVVMAGGATTQCPNVYWWVAQAATLNTSNFLGTILAGADITVTGGTFIGDALAGGAGTTSLPTGFVTLTNTRIQSCPPAGGTVVHTKNKCNQGVGNGPEGCDPGNSNQGDPSRSNDEFGGTPGDPGRKGGDVVDLSKGWKVYNIDAATSKWDIEKAAAFPGGVAQFPFDRFVSTTSGSFAVYLLNNFNSDITGKTISGNMAWDEGTYLTRGPASDGAFVRLEFQDVGNGHFVSNDYWWSSVSLDLNAVTSGTLTAALTDRTLWTNICGQSATDIVAHPGPNCTGGTDPAVSPFDGFTNAMKNVKLVGLSFGRASRFASGVAVTVTPASFRLNTFTITP